jgi:hypothetical protein
LERTEQSILLLSASCAAAIIVFFSMSHTQYDVYVMPAFCPLAIILGLSIDRWIRQIEGGGDLPKVLRFVSPVLAALGALVFPVSIAAGFVLHGMQAWMPVAIGIAGALFCAALVSQYFLFRKKRPTAAVFSMALLYCASVLCGNAAIEQYYYHVKFEDVQELTKLLADTPGEVAQYCDFNLSLLYYRKGPMDYFYNVHELVTANQCTEEEQRIAHRPMFVLVHKRFEKELTSVPELRMELAAKRGDWRIYRSDDAILRHRSTLEECLKTQSWSDLLNSRYKNPMTMPYGGGDYPARLCVDAEKPTK